MKEIIEMVDWKKVFNDAAKSALVAIIPVLTALASGYYDKKNS